MFHYYIIGIIFILGLIIGSFINAVIHRLYSRESIAFQKKISKTKKDKTKNILLLARSSCPICKHQLKWYDLIPVISFILLKAKCRYCHKSISFQYPLVEIGAGLLFVLSFHYLIDSILWIDYPLLAAVLLLLYFIIIACLIIIAVYDIKHLLIPQKPLLIAIISALLINIILDIKIFQAITFNWQSILVTGFLAALLLSSFFCLIFIASKGKWIGFGDVKLAILLGLLIGITQNIIFIIFVLFSASLIGSIVSIVLIISKKKSLKSPIPFAPFLILTTLIVLFWKNDIIYLYNSLLQALF